MSRNVEKKSQTTTWHLITFTQRERERCGSIFRMLSNNIFISFHILNFEPSPTCIAAISSELSLSKRGIGFQPRDFSMSPWKMIVTRQHPVTTVYMQHHTLHPPPPYRPGAELGRLCRTCSWSGLAICPMRSPCRPACRTRCRCPGRCSPGSARTWHWSRDHCRSSSWSGAGV